MLPAQTARRFPAANHKSRRGGPCFPTFPVTREVEMQPGFIRSIVLCIFCAPFFCALALPTFAADPPVHGLWVWKSPTVLEASRAAEALRDFCQSEGINEVYVSVSARTEAAEESQLVQLITLLHRSNVRVEALLSSADADEPGKHREKLLDHVREILQFNRQHSEDRFDGIHLDIEPQQRPENKGPGNLRFLPGLTDAFREVRALADRNRLTVNADIQNKLLKGDLNERKMLLSALPRLTLMLYELSSPADGETFEKQADKLRNSAQKFLDMAYDGLDGRNVAKMSIALRTPDYADRLPAMLKTLDASFQDNSHYLGWARHSYNDHLKTPH
jgi:hypothetical protein